MKTFLVCPYCGDSNWFPHDCSKDEDGVLGDAYECAACGEISFPEDMTSAISDETEVRT